jgi:hypothetical protein
MKIMKKTFALAAAVSLVCLSSAGAMAANKLIVKGTDGTTDKYVVTDAGWIGSGTNAPVGPLHILAAGAASTSQMFFVNNGRAGGVSGDAPAINMFRNNDASIQAAGMPRSGDKLGHLAFGSSFGGANKYTGVIQSYAESAWATNVYPTYLSFATASAANAVERLRITSTGNIGIGTSTPQSKLDVSGGIRIGSSAAPVAGNCTASTRGTLWVQQGTSDTLWICVAVGGTPTWKSVTLTP